MKSSEAIHIVRDVSERLGVLEVRLNNAGMSSGNFIRKTSAAHECRELRQQLDQVLKACGLKV